MIVRTNEKSNETAAFGLPKKTKRWYIKKCNSGVQDPPGLFTAKGVSAWVDFAPVFVDNPFGLV